MTQPVTITGIRTVDFPPSPTGAHQLAKVDFKVGSVFTFTNAMLGWSPLKGARLWLQPVRKDNSPKPTMMLATEINEAVLAAAKRAFEAIGGVYPELAEPRQPEVSAAVALVRQIEQRDNA